MILYAVLLAFTLVERLAELVVGLSNAQWSRARGGREYGQSHYPWMIALHSLFLMGCIVEPRFHGRTVAPDITPLAFGIVVACQLLRWWGIASLGRQWNTRIIVVPGISRVNSGPYRWLRHPNELATVVEGIALPAVGGAWVTAAVFTVLHALLLKTRLSIEGRALEELAPGREAGRS